MSVCSKFSRALTFENKFSRENLCRAPGSSISLSTKTWDVMPDAKIHMSVFALKYPVGGRGGGSQVLPMRMMGTTMVRRRSPLPFSPLSFLPFLSLLYLPVSIHV